MSSRPAWSTRARVSFRTGFKATVKPCLETDKQTHKQQQKKKPLQRGQGCSRNSNKVKGERKIEKERDGERNLVSVVIETKKEEPDHSAVKEEAPLLFSFSQI